MLILPVNYLRVIHCKQNVANINEGYRKGNLEDLAVYQVKQQCNRMVAKHKTVTPLIPQIDKCMKCCSQRLIPCITPIFFIIDILVNGI